MSADEVVETDVCIIGGGPAGCTCALYTSRANLKTVVLDKNPFVGALAITSHIANYPGVDKSMTGTELLDMMRDQAIQYGTDYKKTQVFMVDTTSEDGRKIVYTPDGIFKTKALVLATGAMGRPASFKGEGEYLGKGVSYCATCDGAFYVGEEVVVSGVNGEAVEEALYLTKFAKVIHWITNSEPNMEDHLTKTLLDEPNVKQWPKTKLIEVLGDGGGVTGVRVKKRGEEEEEEIKVEGCFIYEAGSKPITDFLTSGAVDKDEDGGIVVGDDMMTNIDGVFAIGDIRNTPFKQVVVAASDGCIAAMSIDKWLKGRKSYKVDWVHK